MGHRALEMYSWTASRKDLKSEIDFFVYEERVGLADSFGQILGNSISDS